jgi:cytochrome c oxidase cbb3-type subunit 4
MSEEALGIIRGLSTVFAMLAFVGVAAWAWSRRRREDFDRAARSPLEEDVDSGKDRQAHAAAERAHSRQRT